MKNSKDLGKKVIVAASIPVFIFSVYRLYNYQEKIEQEKTYSQELSDMAPDEKTSSVDNSSESKEHLPEGTDEKTEKKEKERKIYPWSEELLQRNNEAVGWIKIPGFVNDKGNEYINFPVLQHDDNDYYLTHNVDGYWDESGSIYADYTHKITLEDQPDNIVIYGHHMRNLGTSFTHLAEYKDGVDFLKNHPIVEFNTIYDEAPEEYIIISCYVAAESESQDDDLFDYWRYLEFDDNEYQFKNWLKRTKECSWYSCDIQCDENDQYITLSTCSNEVLEMRWVITAKKLDEDDNKEKIIDSYTEKKDEDIYFPQVWKNVWGNHKKYLGWNY